jgi:Berberine and berberine like.
LYEENPKCTFFGSHYDRLKEIKDKYDPEGVFEVAEALAWTRGIRVSIVAANDPVPG